MLDLDGTLTDPYDGITRCAMHAFAAAGVSLSNEVNMRSFVGPPLQDWLAMHVPPDLVEPAVTAYRERFDRIGWSENRVYDGVPEMLEALRSASCRMAVVTSKPTIFAQRIVEHFGVAAYFEQIVGATLDGSLRHKADLIALALELTGASADDSVMVGDRAQDAVGARANSVRPIGVGWGYAEPGELEAAGANYVARTPADLAAYLTRGL